MVIGIDHKLATGIFSVFSTILLPVAMSLTA
jgi:hypothetical protein